MLIDTAKLEDELKKELRHRAEAADLWKHPLNRARVLMRLQEWRNRTFGALEHVQVLAQRHNAVYIPTVAHPQTMR